MREQLAAALKLDSEPAEAITDVPADAQAETETVAEAPAPEAQEAPSYWPADERARFAQLPPETQKYLLERVKEQEADYTKKTMEVAEQRKAAEEITRLFDGRKQQLDLAGMTPAQAIQRLLAAQEFLESNPAEAVRWLAQSYNVKLDAPPPKEDEAYLDPAVKSLRDELNQLKLERQREQQAVQQQTTVTIQKQITEFQAAKNEDGTLKYPHFDKVKAIMAPLVAEGKTLAEAYSVAEYTLPEVQARIRDEVAKTAQADALKKAEEARKAKAKEVKGAGQVIRSRGAAADVPSSKRTLREELAANLAEASGRI